MVVVLLEILVKAKLLEAIVHLMELEYQSLLKVVEHLVLEAVLVLVAVLAVVHHKMVVLVEVQ